MVDKVQRGPPDNSQIPHESLGVIIYNKLKKWDANRTCLIDWTGQAMTCGQFLQESVNLAKKILDLGVKKGDVVTIVAQNQSRFLVSMVAGWYIGATVNLLNHDYTSGELKHFLSICKPTLIFCTAKTSPHVFKLQTEEFFPSHVIVYDQPSTPELENSANFTPLDLDLENVALILTSSGTTGVPKCVQITHKNIRISMTYLLDPNCIDVNQNETMLGFLPFFHIFGLFVATASIIAGAKLVILDKFTPDGFLGAIQNNKVTKLLVVPPVLLFLVKSPLVEKHDLSSINDILCGAASVTKEVEDMVEKKLNVTSVRQVYGMTETSGAVTLIPKNTKREGSTGKVTTTHEIVVCDVESGVVLPANQVGELRFKGGGVMKGYLKCEVEDAFDEKGYLRSGDLGYYDDEGFFYIVDRLKEIIKYKGFQVPPTELENLLIQHPGVKDAGVVGKPDERAGEVPVAFVVKQPGVDVTEEELVTYVAENLSVQKHLYGGVRFIEEIPKSSSGKILRRNLKKLIV